MSSVVAVVLVLSRRMTLELFAVEEDGEEWQLFGMFIAVPNANLGIFSSRPKIGKFGQLDTRRERDGNVVEEATLVQCVVLIIETWEMLPSCTVREGLSQFCTGLLSRGTTGIASDVDATVLSGHFTINIIAPFFKASPQASSVASFLLLLCTPVDTNN